MRKLRAPELGVVAVVLAFACAAAAILLGEYLRRRGLDFDAKLSDVVAGGLAAVAVIVSAAGRFVRWLPTPKLRASQIDSDVAELASAVRALGRFDGPLSGLYVYDRLPMPVRWRLATGALAGQLPPARSGPEPERSAGTFDEVLEFFGQLPESRLLVLGAAGAGKTVLITELARRLLAVRADVDPVPVVVPLAAWDPGQDSLFDWVSEQLVRINADLAHRVLDGRRTVTRAQALVDRMKVVPILDGLDEIDDELRPKATVAINQYGWSQPLVVTCRTATYQQTVTADSGTPIARMAVVAIEPLTAGDIKAYLGPGDRWRALYAGLDAEPGGPLASALANPLMLWLAWAVYSGSSRDPAELTDKRRFDSIAPIEHHLLTAFVPAVYPPAAVEDPDEMQRPAFAFRLRPQRWLGFLADAAGRYRGARIRKPASNRPLDQFEARDDQNVAWWRFTAAAGGWRFFGVVLRGALIWTVVWQLGWYVVRRDGYLRHGVFAGPLHFRTLFAAGRLGQAVWPTVRRVIDAVPATTRQHAFADVNHGVMLLLGSRPAIPVAVLLAMALGLGAVYAFMEPPRPRHLQLSARQLLQLGWNVIFGVAFLALLGWGVLVVWHRTGLAGTIFSARSTWYALAAISLAVSLPGVPATLAVPTDVVGTAGPHESLRLDRWTDIVVTVTGRCLAAVVIWLVSGSSLAEVYAVAAGVCTVIAFGLGGRNSSAASRSYTDACIWLALTRKLPWQPMDALDEAERRGVFVEVGALFRFRHARVQRQLSNWYGHYRQDLTGWPAAWHRVTDRFAPLFEAETLIDARVRVTSYRWLADQNLAGFGSDLARALEHLSGMLRSRGYQDDELDALASLVDLRRKLAAASPAERPALVRSILGFACRLDALGRYGETPGLIAEATGLMCQLDDAGRDDLLPDLEQALTWLERTSGPDERRLAAIRTVADALDAYCRHILSVTPGDPDSRATTLMRLGWLRLRHSALPGDGQLARAIELMTEAVHLYATISPDDPDELLTERSAELIALADEFARLRRPAEVRCALDSAISLDRELIQRGQLAIGGSLRRALSRRASLSESHDAAEEKSAIRAAVAEFGALADRGEPPDDRSDLSVLSQLALRLWRLGERDDAVAAAAAGRLLAAMAPPAPADSGTDRLIWDTPAEAGREQRPGARWPRSSARRAEHLDTEAFRMLLADRPAEAEADALLAAGYRRQIAERYRKLAGTRPATYLDDLADSLEQLAIQLRKAGPPGSAACDEAAAADAEALNIRQRLTPQPAPPAESGGLPAGAAPASSATLETVDD